MATKKKPRTTRARRSVKKSRAAPKTGKRKKPAIDLDRIAAGLRSVKSKLQEMMQEDASEPGEFEMRMAKAAAEQMQEINRGLREALKRAMMADGKIKPGQVLSFKGRRVFLKPRPGCPEGSMDPEHYDLTYEFVS